MGNAVLADPRGQMQLPVSGVRLNEVFNSTLEVETTSPWPEPRSLEGMESGVAPRQLKRARRAAVAVPGSQVPGVTINSVAPHPPLLKLPLNSQSATASRQSRQKKILTEVGAGSNLMTVRYTAHYICFGT